MFLTDAQLTTLTGYKVKAKRIEALKDMHIPFILNARGHIIVRTDYDVNRRVRQDAFVPGEVS